MVSVVRSFGRCALILIVLLPAAAFQAPAQLASPAAAEPDTVSLERRMWIAAKIYGSVQAYFGHWEAVPNLDLDEAFREYQAAAIAAGSRFEFDLATMEFMARLRNGHSGFTDRWLFEVGGGPVGFTARRSQGVWVVHTSRLAPLAPGDVIRTIDGRPAERFVSDLLPYVPASSERAAIRSLWFQSYLFPESFEVELDVGRRVTIDRAGQELEPSTRRPYEEKIREDGTAYLYIPSFGEPDMEQQAVEFLLRNPDVPALIIDVRANSGGTTPNHLIEALMDRPYRGFTESTSVTYGLFEAYAKISREGRAGSFNDYVRGYLDAFDELGRAQIRMPGTPVPPRDPIYTGPLFVLTDDGCASACEDFVMPLRTSERATVVGSRTSGSTGQPYMHDFGDRMSFRVSAKRVYFPDGSQFEGFGILPHVEVTPTAEDLRAGRDPVLERAEELVAGA
jgi:carboxyl-terminal processing protease